MSRKGIAQLVVLWALLLLGTLAMSFAFSMRTEAQASRNGLEAARAYFMARTGVERTIALLSTGATDNVLAGPVTGGEDGATYEARVMPENGKIDINHISEEGLKEILRNSGLSEDEVESMGDAILDWRDEDDQRRPAGAEEQDYASLPEPVKPRNGRLASVGELRYVRGVPPEFFSRVLANVFTVDSGRPGVNMNAAPLEVLRVLPGFTPELAALVVERRNESPFRSPGEIAAFLAAEGAGPLAIPVVSSSAASRVYTITSTGKAEGTVTRVIRCTIEAGGGRNPTRIRRWEDHVPTYGEAA
jgi:type II secretory pathway component PulK